VRAGHRAGQLRGPEGPEQREGGQGVPGGGDRAEQERADRELVPHRQHDPVGQLAGPRQPPAGDQARTDLAEHEDADEDGGGDAEGGQEHAGRQCGAGEDHEDGEPDRADQPVQRHLGDR
jgi:hypothetical protein